jgi:hypothetical protein
LQGIPTDNARRGDTHPRIRFLPGETPLTWLNDFIIFIDQFQAGANKIATETLKRIII